jgi:hypothetical protein
MLTTVWEPHSERGCALCKQFRQRGRPRKFSREEAHAMEHLNRTTVQSWGDPKPLCPARFLPPAQGASLTDLQCNRIPDQPVQSSCGKLVCITSHFKTHNSELTCCGTDHHPSSFSPASDLLVKIVSTLIIHCSRCNSTVELKSIKAHTTSGCALAFPLSPSKLTVRQLMSQPADAPPHEGREDINCQENPEHFSPTVA